MKDGYSNPGNVIQGIERCNDPGISTCNGSVIQRMDWCTDPGISTCNGSVANVSLVRMGLVTL
jgi:hypothetical protein